MLNNFRYANEEQRFILADEVVQMPDNSVQTNTFTIPVNPANRLYREVILPYLQGGGIIAGGNDTRLRGLREKRMSQLLAEILKRMVTTLRPTDGIRSDARATATAILQANTLQELRDIDPTNW